VEVTRAGTSRAVRRVRQPGHWLAVAAGVLLVLSVLPLETIVRRYLFAESIQFCAFAMVIPALAVLGAPWAPRQGRLAFGGAMAAGVVYVGLCLLWRLPPVLDALARHPILQLPELMTLLLAGTVLWLQLVNSPASAARLTRPQRAAVAALAMWSTWVIAYVLGFANHAVIHAYDLSGPLGAVADQEVTAALTWAVAAACFIPVICVTLLGWLRDSGVAGAGPTEEMPVGRNVPAVRGWNRAPRSR
jgi:cytochrome c oxidase assembly factor CtaG